MIGNDRFERGSSYEQITVSDSLGSTSTRIYSAGRGYGGHHMLRRTELMLPAASQASFLTLRPSAKVSGSDCNALR